MGKQYNLNKNTIKWRSFERRIVVVDYETNEPIKVYYDLNTALRKEKLDYSRSSFRRFCITHKKIGNITFWYADEYEDKYNVLLPGAKVLLPV